MRRIATLVATGAVATAAAVTLAVSPASADTAAVALKGTAASTSAGAFSTAATHHGWASKGKAYVSASGWYAHSTKSGKKITQVYGYIKDTRSKHSKSKTYGGVFIKFWDAGYKHWDYKLLFNNHHGTTEKFPYVYYSYKHSHLQIAEVYVKKTSKGWSLVNPSNPGTFHKVF